MTAEARSPKTIVLTVPSHSNIELPKDVKKEKISKTEYRLYFTQSTTFPLEIKVKDLFSATVMEKFQILGDVKDVYVKQNILHGLKANSVSIYELPQLCPRVRSDEKITYQGSLDLINHIPTMHLFDPDVNEKANQVIAVRQFDRNNVLLLRRIKISYDYEDTAILDYRGPHPLTKKEHLVYEGEGGFYANFHYAIIPYDEKVLKLNRQELLNLVQGKLANIDREDLLPPLRLHSLLPGPYQSNDKVYPLCEWGDTSFQTPVQEMYYEQLYLWDWDIGPWKKLILVVWEGDEEDWMIADGLLDPYYLTDDVVGVFTIDKAKTLTPLTIKNKASNFEMEVMTMIKPF